MTQEIKSIPQAPDPLAFATAKQQLASDPVQSVWVNASAGTGKTKVLTDRVLRLLLPGPQDEPGARPDSILCLTYTRAAASEMVGRLGAILSEWVIFDDLKLSRRLSELTGSPATPAQIEQARQLFSRVVDGPGQVRIMTIHAFCQSVLARFPLEAGLSPTFKQIEEEEANALLRAARQQVFTTDIDDPFVKHVAGALHETGVEEILADLLKDRHALKNLFEKFDDHGLLARYKQTLDLKPDDTLAAWEQIFSGDSARHVPVLQRLAKMMAQGSARDADRGTAFLHILEDANPNFETLYNALVDFFYGLTGKPYAVPTKATLAKNPEGEFLYAEEFDWFDAHRQRRQRLELCEQSFAMLQVARRVLEGYTRRKQQAHALDFDDLIHRTADLLRGNTAGNPNITWVLYKLDSGIDHILVDEAQDTNPEQWDIIQALVDEFFSGKGSRSDRPRTLFVVGDDKQSIYSFQKADPEVFLKVRADLMKRAEESRRPITPIPLDLSFRSTAPVLDLVDATFANESFATRHIVRRVGQAGRVELWPKIVPDPEDESSPSWDLPVTIRDPKNSVVRISQKIAQTIRLWLDQKKFLPSYGRAVEPGDIMILVRARQPMVPVLLAALRAQNIPVSGLDRMHLMESLAVQDLIAAVNFVLQPGDDLNLACLLKSSFLGLDDQALMALAIGRGSESLWQRVQADPAYADVADYLRAIGTPSDNIYQFLMRILSTPCPGDTGGTGGRALRCRLGDEILDPIGELLQAALAFSATDITGLQGFAHHIARDNPVVKRDAASAAGCVRIMTVHGSKGLEAPIVMLPDTVRSSRGKKSPRIFWTEGDTTLPLWVPRKESRIPLIEELDEKRKQAANEENKRLLYVAMTRARDHLIVAGAEPNQAEAGSWYDKVASGFDKLGQDQRDVDGVRFIEVPQTAEPDRAENISAAPATLSLPGIFHTPLPPEPAPSRPLRPDRPSGSDLVQSPVVAAQDPYRFRRGLITHKLLQVLPDLPPASWEAVAHDFTARHGADLSQEIQTSLVAEVIALLNNPAFSALVGSGSLAEVPVTGQLPDGRLISGQIDRLVITDSEILILDYKTNRPPPARVIDIPPVYLGQMRAYRDLLRLIYPGRRVRAMLVWTDGPVLMELPETILESA